jgi:hypothetical protein
VPVTKQDCVLEILSDRACPVLELPSDPLDGPDQPDCTARGGTPCENTSLKQFLASQLLGRRRVRGLFEDGFYAAPGPSFGKAGSIDPDYPDISIAASPRSKRNPSTIG